LVAYYGHDRDLPSFPTRRSSDLVKQDARAVDIGKGSIELVRSRQIMIHFHRELILREARLVCYRERRVVDQGDLPIRPLDRWRRSEEHTSELQSRENLVCRLLLE